MPGATLPQIGIILPSLGGDSGSWDDRVNAALTLIDAHDHTSGKGARVTSAALNINADLSFGNNAITALGKIGFTAITAPASGSKNLFVSTADNELYWRTNGGTNVKLTNGSGINISLVGGIVGDYAAAGAEVAYDDANDRYTFKQQGSPKPWARIACGGIRLYEFNTTETVYTGLIVDAALASSYDLTLPAALPGSQVLVQVGTTGNLIFSSSGVTSITMASNANITLSGTGDYKHGNKTIHQTSLARQVGGTVTTTSDDVINTLVHPTTSFFPLMGLKVGDRLQSVKLFATSASNPTVEIIKQLNGAGAAISRTASGGPISSTGNQTFTPDSLETITSTSLWKYYLKVTTAADLAVEGLQITFDRP